MAKKLSLIPISKMFEATRVHPKSGLPLQVPPTTIPYGALVEYVGADRDDEKFTYLGELYACKRDLFQSAIKADKGPAKTAHAAAAVPSVDRDGGAANKPRLEWQQLPSSDYSVRRAAVPGGWLVALDVGVTFLPDPRHRWDGTSKA